MSRVQGRAWSLIDHEKISFRDNPYWIVGFYREPHFAPQPIKLDSGDILHPGGTVAFLGGRKTSAGFDILYPVAPIVFRYEGVFHSITGERLVVWQPMDETTGEEWALESGEFHSVKYGHALGDLEDGGQVLAYSITSGAGRIIQTDLYYASHNDLNGKSIDEVLAV